MHSMHQISSYFAPLMEAFDPFLDNLFDRSFVFSGGGTLAWTCRLYRYLYVSENKHVFIHPTTLHKYDYKFYCKKSSAWLVHLF